MVSRHSNSRVRVLVSLSLVVLLATFAAVGLSCGAPSFSEDTRDKLEAALNSTMTGSKAPGAITGVWTPEGTWVVSRGEANVEADVPMKTTDIMRIGSVTKTFTATLVLQLADEGKLGLDDKLEKYVPDFPNSDRITIRQLLTHTSGIPEWAEDDKLREEVFSHPGEGWTIEKMVHIVGEQPLLFEPGTDYSYSNVGYFLLGAIIEEVAGNTVEGEIDKRIAGPLGLENTFLPGSAAFEGDIVHGYEELDGKVVDTTGTEASQVLNYDLAYTAGGMVSTLEDLKVWAKALATGELLSEKMHQEQLPADLKESPGSPVKSGYGMGVGQQDVWIGHSGAIAGFFVNMGYYPEKDATIVTFFNKFTAIGDIEANTADIKTYGEYFVELSKIIYPETYKGVPVGE